MKILDCTLRDGGYYTNWDFESSLVDTYLAAVNQLPIDYIEVGYRNLPQDDYMGEYGYCPVSTLQHIRKQCSKKIRRTAKEIGMETVELDDTSGMSFMNRGTVIDLAALMKYAIENSSLLRDTGSQLTHRMLYLRRGVRPCRRNLVSTIDYNAFVSDKYRIVGAKTGSGDGIYNLMMGLVYNDATSVAIVANAHSEEQRTIEMKALLAYMIGKKSETELKNVVSNESCVLLGNMENLG